MHFLFNLLNRMLPLTVMVFDQSDEVPVGFDRVITNTNAFVTTSNGDNVIANI